MKRPTLLSIVGGSLGVAILFIVFSLVEYVYDNTRDPVGLAPGVKVAAELAVQHHQVAVLKHRLATMVQRLSGCEVSCTQKLTARRKEVDACWAQPVCAVTMRDLALRVDRRIWTPGSGMFVVLWKRHGRRGTIRWLSPARAFRRYYPDEWKRMNKEAREIRKSRTEPEIKIP